MQLRNEDVNNPRSGSWSKQARTTNCIKITFWQKKSRELVVENKMLTTNTLHDTHDINEWWTTYSTRLDKITRFHVAMEVSTLVHVSKTLENLKTPISNFTFREQLFPIFHKMVKVAFLHHPEIDIAISILDLKSANSARLSTKTSSYLPYTQKQSTECHFLE